MSDNRPLIQRFLEEQYCLIVEPSQAFASTVQFCLAGLGVKSGMILTARKYADACKMIADKKPKLLITEYEIERQFGLALVEMQEHHYAEDSRISMVVTKNSSDSVVAEAAEEQVDAFLLKPFSADALSEKIKGVLDRKTNPSPYVSKIRDGKVLLSNKDYVGAVREFKAAKSLHEKPTLACYYAGSVMQNHAKWDPALLEFREGRQYQPLHYKCLIGEFEVLISQKRFAEAHQLVAPIKNNYPLTPRRLGQLIMASIFTKHFEEIMPYFQLYSALETRSQELNKITSMAMFTAGRHYLEVKDIAQATQLFEKGAIVAAREFTYLERVITELLQAKAIDAAQDFLGKAQASTVGTPEHNRLAFKVDLHVLSRSQMIERARKLVQNGEATPDLYKTIVELMVTDGKVTLAESVIARAVQEFPDLRASLFAILESKSPKQSA